MRIAVSQVIIGCLVVVGFFGSLILLLSNPQVITETNSEPVMLMIGALIAAFSGLMGFYFGSSAGSARKTELIAGSAPDEIIELKKPIQKNS